MIIILGWILLTVAGLALEAVSIFDKKRNNTLSTQVWFLRTIKWSRATLFAGWNWMTYHFWYEDLISPVLATSNGDDIILVIVSGIIGYFLKYDKREGK